MLGEDHPDTAASYDSMAVNSDSQCERTENELLFRKELAISGPALGEDDLQHDPQMSQGGQQSARTGQGPAQTGQVRRGQAVLSQSLLKSAARWWVRTIEVVKRTTTVAVGVAGNYWELLTFVGAVVTP